MNEKKSPEWHYCGCRQEINHGAHRFVVGTAEVFASLETWGTKKETARLLEASGGRGTMGGGTAPQKIDDSSTRCKGKETAAFLFRESLYDIVISHIGCIATRRIL